MSGRKRQAGKRPGALCPTSGAAPEGRDSPDGTKPVGGALSDSGVSLGSRMSTDGRVAPDDEVAGTGASSSVLKVIYDGECNLCLATAAKLRAIRTDSRLEWISLQSLQAGETPAWPAIAGIPPDRLAAQLHVTDEAGRLYGGPDAVMRLLRDVPSLRWLGVVGAWPGLRTLSSWAYRLIARYRYQLFGKSEACANGACSLPRNQPRNGGN